MKYIIHYKDVIGKRRTRTVYSEATPENAEAWFRGVLPMYGCKFVSMYMELTAHTRKRENT